MLRNLVAKCALIVSQITKIPRSSVNQYELKILNSFSEKSDLLLIDVGARTDTVFVQGQENSRIFLIEGNPFFAQILRFKLFFKRPGRCVKVENFFVSDKDAPTTIYYRKSQSMFKNVMLPGDRESIVRVPQMRLDTFLVSRDISEIDFIKFDIEGNDYHGLLSLGDFLDKCRYIQFELGVTQSWSGSVFNLEMYYSLLQSTFSLYLIRDDRNPLFARIDKDIDLIELDLDALEIVTGFLDQLIGFNCFAISKKLNESLPVGLVKGRLDKRSL